MVLETRRVGQPTSNAIACQALLVVAAVWLERAGASSSPIAAAATSSNLDWDSLKATTAGSYASPLLATSPSGGLSPYSSPMNRHQQTDYRRQVRDASVSASATALSAAVRSVSPDTGQLTAAFRLIADDAASTTSEGITTRQDAKNRRDRHQTKDSNTGTVDDDSPALHGARGAALTSASEGVGDIENNLSNITPENSVFLRSQKLRGVVEAAGGWDHVPAAGFSDLDSSTRIASLSTAQSITSRTSGVAAPAAVATAGASEEGFPLSEYITGEGFFPTPQLFRVENEQQEIEVGAEIAAEPRESGFVPNEDRAGHQPVSARSGSRSMGWRWRRWLQADGGGEGERSVEEPDDDSVAIDDSFGSVGLLAFVVCFGLFFCVMEVAKCYCLIECRRRQRQTRRRESERRARLPVATSRPVPPSVPGPGSKEGWVEVIVDGKTLSDSVDGTVEGSEMPSVRGYPVADASNVLREAIEHAQRLSPRNGEQGVGVSRSPPVPAANLPPRSSLARTLSSPAQELRNLFNSSTNRVAAVAPYESESPATVRAVQGEDVTSRSRD